MSDYIRNLQSNLRASIEAKQTMIGAEKELATFAQAVDWCVTAYRQGGRLYIAGNGGSAADAQHLATEFVSKLARPRAALPAEALTTDTSTITAIGNDFGFDQIFSRQIEGKMTSKDIFFGITTSGESQNIVRALEQCRKQGIRSIVLSGREGGKVKPLADLCIVVPHQDTSRIQEVHAVIYHTLCGCVESALFPA